MFGKRTIIIAIIDYGLGNLFSVQHACRYAGIDAMITTEKKSILAADAVILPGVGAFGDAMEVLRKLDLISVLRDVVASGKMLVGICLGLQLLMSESYEFGKHPGLGLIEGEVVRFSKPVDSFGKELKVPQIGWNRINKKNDSNPRSSDDWINTPLSNLANGEYMYFVHSYYAVPENSEAILTLTRYGNINFVSSLRMDNIFATQFHPERSGPHGLQIYKNIANTLLDKGN